MKNLDLFRTCAILVVVSFVLHLAWEFSHYGLYTGYTAWSGNVPVYILATLGDVLYTLGAFALVSAIKKTYDWMKDATVQDYFLLVTIGFLVSLFVEYKALMFMKWQYLPEMPIIPILNVGLSPIMQMSLLLPLSVLLTHAVDKYLFSTYNKS